MAGEPVDQPATWATEQMTSGPHVAVRRFHLTVEAGPDAGATYRAAGPRVVIGTHRTCHFILRDRTVSGFHCEIVLASGRALLRDLGSKNGTRANGIGVLEATLEGTATLTLGQTRVRFELGDSDLQIPLAERDRFGELIGGSSAMRMAFAVLERAAASDATVLIHGETGTGKELAAEAIHGHSRRRAAPFVVVDCGAIAGGLFESELFGHDAGAFTGAVTARAGAFEQASGGTLFLDEIGELEPELQPKLLRAIESRRIRRVGGATPISVDTRVVAATNRDLKREVNSGRFRADLYYRLAVLELWLPPLRERPDDIPLLVADLLRQLGAADDPAAAALFAEPTRRDLASHPWPGNVRELRNYVQRCLAASARLPITEAAAAGRPEIDVAEPLRVARDRFVRYFERQYLSELLARHDGNVAAAAEAAGVDRTHFYRVLARAGLR